MRTSGILVLLSVLASPASVAQGGRHLTLRPANAELGEEFTYVGSVRELADGRVLIADPRDGRVVVVDFKAGTVQQVGRKGQGPNEYANVGIIHALGADSSLLPDALSRRWLLLAGPSIVTTLPAETPIIKALKGYARGADGRGNVWMTESPLQFDEKTARPGTITTSPTDSDIVVRGNRGTGRVDTVTRLRSAVMRQTVKANLEGKFSSVSVTRPPLSTGEEAVLFPDGWFAVARLEPYRVDWISPDGRVNRGAAIPVTPIKVTGAEKDAYFARQAASRTGGPPIPEALRREMDAMRDQFPEVFPPFSPGGLLAGGDGNLWLRHPLSKDFPSNRYDVVDRRGQLVGTVALGKGERIVGVSRTAVYVAWKDEDDIERLRRHPLP